jgi:hypothetical protein
MIADIVGPRSPPKPSSMDSGGTLKSVRKSALVDACERNGLPKSGTKEVLLARLKAHIMTSSSAGLCC